jgi:hypothetical protein
VFDPQFELDFAKSRHRQLLLDAQKQRLVKEAERHAAEQAGHEQPARVRPSLHVVIRQFIFRRFGLAAR